MSKHFSSILKLVESEDLLQEKASVFALETNFDAARVSVLPAAEAVENHEPHPPQPNKRVSHNFDKVLSAEIDSVSLYKEAAREVVESTLLGYHGSIVSLSTSSARPEKSAALEGLIQKAASQIFRCLKKSRKSKSNSSASNLIVKCSYVIITEEEVRDLFHGYRSSAKVEVIPPKLGGIMNGKPVGASEQVITAGSKVEALLQHGKGLEQRIIGERGNHSHQQLHHKIFTLAVEFNQFGSMNFPVSGNLSFIDISATDPLGSKHSFMKGSEIDTSVLSLFAFADLVELLAPSTGDSSALPCVVPTMNTDNAYNSSTLTRLIRDSLGGNCKTIMITFLPVSNASSSSAEVQETLKLASRARTIQNSPNKRDLAEKALMSAYMRGLQERYGKQVTVGKKPSGSAVPVSMEEEGKKKEKKNSGSQDSLKSKDMDEAYGQMIEMSKREEREKEVEMAASALVAAALKRREGGETSSESESEQEDEGEGSLATTEIETVQTVESDKKGLVLSDKQNVTLEALVAILQDPDTGVPRPSAADLKHVKIQKDAGALFSSAAIVRWLLANVNGVKSEEDAEKLGQLLLDSGHIFHSEGSRVFAYAESLFYHARYAKSRKKTLTLEEIEFLLQMANSKPPNLVKTEPQKQEITNGTLEGKNMTSEEQSEVPDLAPSKTDVVPIPNETDLRLEDVDGQEAVTKSDNEMEEWMKMQSEEEEMNEEEREEKEEEVEVQNEPYTAPLEKIPSLHTLENTENYPHPLHMAAAIGKGPGVIRELVMMFGVNKLDNSYRTPLMFAALGNNKSSTCSTLLQCSAEVNAQDASGLTALHVACYHGNKSAASVLLSNKASIDIKDNTGHTALHWSMVPDDPSCLKLLTRHSLHPDLLNHVDSSKLTAIHWSIYYNHPQHLSILLKRYSKRGQIQLTAVDSEGRTLAMYAIEKQSPQCLNVLLTFEPSLLTLLDNKGSSPSHYASVQATTDYLRILLGFSPPKNSTVRLDINTVNELQRTALHYAVAHNRMGSAELLVSKGAEVEMRDDSGKTALEYAMDLIDEEKEEMLAILRGEAAVSSSESNAVVETQTRSKVCNVL